MKVIFKQIMHLSRQKMAYSALVARNTIAGRSLIAVISIMSFLASLSLGFVFLMNQASSQWTQSVSHEITIQIRPLAGHQLDDDVSKMISKLKTIHALNDVRAISKKESDDMLEPWLGSGLDLSDLPIPRLIVAKIDNQKNLNITQLQSDLSAILPNASLDDHARWNDRLKIMSRTMVLIALIIFALVMAAMILAVSFVTHGTMAENSEVINVLHFVGAENIYIAKEFQSHFLILGLRGGIVGGLLSAGAFFMLDRSFLLWAHGPEGDQLIALLGQPSLPIGGYFAIACVAVLAGLLTAIVSRLIVMRHLNNLW